MRFAAVVMGLTLLIAVLAIVALAFFPSQAVAEQLAAAPAITLPVIFAAVGIGIVMLALSIRFALELGRIVRTVQQGDPFELANADRLARMGWLALGVTISGWLLMPLAWWMEQYFNELSVGNSPELSGLVLSATPFILARVFATRRRCATICRAPSAADHGHPGRDAGAPRHDAHRAFGTRRSHSRQSVDPQNRQGQGHRFSTLAAICRERDCQPADLLGYRQ